MRIENSKYPTTRTGATQIAHGTAPAMLSHFQSDRPLLTVSWSMCHFAVVIYSTVPVYAIHLVIEVHTQTFFALSRWMTIVSRFLF